MTDPENNSSDPRKPKSSSSGDPTLNEEKSPSNVDHEEAVRRFKKNLETNDRFDLISEIGVGGMGVVFEAFDRQQDSRVALKTMIHLQPTELYRFKKEFRSLANIAHPNLIRLYELFSDGTEWFYTMELIDGVDFNTWVRPLPNLEAIEDDPTIPMQLEIAPQNDDRLRKALGQLVEGVRALHQEGKLHRDIKPSNILVRKDGVVRILDFGLIKDVGDKIKVDGKSPPVVAEEYFAHSVQTVGGIAGSVSYMAPEQAGGGELTEACDWYAVGVILFESLTGRRPFLGTGWNVLSQKQQSAPPHPSDFASNLPTDLVELCVQLLSRDPEVRMGGVAELVDHSTQDSANEVNSDREDTRLPFFGRETLLESIRSTSERVRDGEMAMLHLHGRSGAGKSALANRFLTELEGSPDVLILAGRCYEQETVPYKALDSLIDSVTRHLLSLELDDAQALIPSDIAALGRIFPVLDRVEAVRNAPPRDIADPFELRRVAFDALAQLLCRLGDRHHLVIYIDDLQWGDGDSARFIKDLIQARFPPRMLFVASYRSEYRDRSPCLISLPRVNEAKSGGVFIDELEVGPLSTSEAEKLATALLTVNTKQAKRIALESGGNPYFVYELASLVNFEVTHQGSGGAISQLDLDDALWARVRRLERTPQALLEVLGVSGRPTPLRFIYEAAGINSSGLPGLALLRAGHLIRRSGPGLDDEVECFHDRIRETIVAHLDPPTQTRHHLGLARSLESAADSDSEAIAFHYQGAGEFEPAGLHYSKAAAQAAKALAFERAANLYRKTLQFSHLNKEEEREIQIKLADALANAGRGAEAAAVYLSAAEELKGVPAHRLQERAGYQFCTAGRIDEGRECFRGVLRHLGLKLPATRRAALFSLIRRRIHLLFRGTKFSKRSEEDLTETEINRIDLSWAVAGGMTVIDPIPAADFQTHNLLLALKAGEPCRISRALAWEASHTSMVGQRFRTRVERLLGEAGQLADELDEPMARGTVDLARCVAAFFLGDFATCRTFGDRAAQLFREECAGAAWELDQSQTFAYWACYWLGDLRDLTNRQQSLLAAARERGAQLVESQLTTFGGPFVWLAQDNPDKAKTAHANASAHWKDVEYQVYHYTALTAKCQIALYENRNEEALAMIESEWDFVAGALLLHVELVKVYITFLRARCSIAAAIKAKDREHALKVARKDARTLKKLLPLWSKAAGAQIAASLAFLEEDTSLALSELDQAIAGFQEENFGLHEWCARFQKARLIDPAGDSAESIKVNRWFEEHGIQNPEAMVWVNTPGFGLSLS